MISRFAEANFARINNKAGFLMGIIRRVREDGPDGGGADLKILPRSVEHAIRGLMDEARAHDVVVVRLRSAFWSEHRSGLGEVLLSG